MTERERLIGYPTGYTLGLFRKEAETGEQKKKQTVAREAAIGNSFHTVIVACLLGLWLWKKQARTAKVIVEKWHEEMTSVRRMMHPLTSVSMSERDKEGEAALVQVMRNPKRGAVAPIGRTQLWERWRSPVAEREVDPPVPTSDGISWK